MKTPDIDRDATWREELRKHKPVKERTSTRGDAASSVVLSRHMQ